MDVMKHIQLRQRSILLGLALSVAVLLLGGGYGVDRLNVSRLSFQEKPQPARQQSELDTVRFLSDFQKAARKADQEAKPLFVFFTLPDCVNSQKMVQTTFQDDEIKRLSQRFICVKVDASVDPELCERLKVEGFPTILFLSPQGIELQRLAGKQSPDHLAVQMHVAIQSTAARLGTVVRK